MTSVSTRCYNRMLIVGDGPYIFSEALVDKYKERLPDLPKHLVTTELERPSFGTAPRIKKLREAGTKVIPGVDATKISEIPEILEISKGRKFDIIRWNCPHAGGSYIERDGGEGKTSKTIREFFLEASRLQGDEGEIWMALALGNRRGNYAEWRQEVAYGVVRAARAAGYVLKRTRYFGPTRYRGYEHRQNGRETPAQIAMSGLKEFVFKKRKDLTKSASIASSKLADVGNLALGQDLSLSSKLFTASHIASIMSLNSFAKKIVSDLDQNVNLDTVTNTLSSISQTLVRVLTTIKTSIKTSTVDADLAKTIKKTIKQALKLISIPHEIYPQKSGSYEYFPDRNPGEQPPEAFPRANLLDDEYYASENEYLEKSSDAESSDSTSSVDALDFLGPDSDLD